MIGEKETQNEMKTNEKKTRNIGKYINGLGIPEGAFQGYIFDKFSKGLNLKPICELNLSAGSEVNPFSSASEFFRQK